MLSFERREINLDDKGVVSSRVAADGTTVYGNNVLDSCFLKN